MLSDNNPNQQPNRNHYLLLRHPATTILQSCVQFAHRTGSSSYQPMVQRKIQDNTNIFATNKPTLL